MCECGCVMNDEKYIFPGPKKSIYILTLSNKCIPCSAPAGVSLERAEPGSFEYKYYKEDYTAKELKFEKWGDAQGVAIKVGPTQNEFVKLMTEQLKGLDTNEMGENGKLDKIGAEVIAEEIYQEFDFGPELV